MNKGGINTKVNKNKRKFKPCYAPFYRLINAYSYF